MILDDCDKAELRRAHKSSMADGLADIAAEFDVPEDHVVDSAIERWEDAWFDSCFPPETNPPQPWHDEEDVCY